jgi:pimeloyl-ACP methyl ester carboxylesterase
LILHAIEAGAGPPVALLHGLFGAARNLGVVQRALAPRHRVLALDLRNHGESPHAEGMAYADLAADVRETLGARGALPCALLGHSMGGKVAMQAALTAPTEVSRLLVADIAPVPYHGAFAAYAEAMAALPLTPGLSRAAAEAALAAAVPEPAVRAFLLQNLRLSPTPAWRIGLAEIRRALPQILDWDAPPGARYPGPALFVAGAQSDYIRPEHRPLIRALFPAARFVTLKGAGHWLHADNPVGFARLAEDFFA